MYIIGYTFGNHILRLYVAVKLNCRPYIAQYTSPNEKFEYSYPLNDICFTNLQLLITQTDANSKQSLGPRHEPNVQEACVYLFLYVCTVLWAQIPLQFSPFPPPPPPPPKKKTLQILQYVYAADILWRLLQWSPFISTGLDKYKFAA